MSVHQLEESYPYSLEPTALFLAATVAPSANYALQVRVRALLKEALYETLGPTMFEMLYGERESFWQAHCQACEALPPFRCPLIAFAGQQDEMIPVQALEAWEKHTSGPFSLHLVPGNHRFPFSHTTLLIEEIKRQLALTEENKQ